MTRDELPAREPGKPPAVPPPDALESMPFGVGPGDVQGRPGEPGAPAAPAAPLPADIDGFRILRRLGEGGMGVVYEAEQAEPNRRVALKVIRASVHEAPELARLFQREVQALSRLKHAGIATLYAAGRTAAGQPWFAMELVVGEPLDRHAATLASLDARPREGIRQRLALMTRLCDAVNFAHQKAVIHRDLKPSNILVLPALAPGAGAASEPEVKVLDFGLARFADDESSFMATLAESGAVRGTLAYMSPEQARGENDAVDFRTDVYSLGVVLYELLTGARPYDLQGRPLHEATRLICEAPIPRPSSHHAALRGDLETIVLKALERDPARRYQGVQALAEDLRRCAANEPILARPPSLAYQLQKLVARHRLPVALAALLVAVLAVFAGAMSVQFATQRRLRLRAEAEAAKAERINGFLQEMLRAANPARQGPRVTVRELLDEAALTLDKNLAGQPEVLAAVERTIGNTYEALGLYPEAEKHLRAAVATLRGAGISRPREVAGSLRDLGEILWRRGEYAASEPLLREALAIDVAASGPASLPAAASHAALGEMLRAAGRPAEGEVAFRRAYDIQRAALGDDDARVARGASNLAAYLQQLGRLAAAESLYRHALSVDAHAYGDSSLETSQSLSDLAGLLRARNQPAAAESLYRRVVAVRRRLLGNDHPEVARTLANLAGCLTDAGQLPEAESVSREALELRRRVLGPDHPDVATSESHLGLVLQNLGRLAEAESLHTRSLRLRRRILTAPNRDLITGLSNLALCYQVQERDAAAEPLYREALEQQERLTGRRHPDYARIANNLGAVLQNQRRFAAAESLYRASLAIRREVLGADHADVATSLNGLATLMIDQRRFADAEPLLRECLALRRRKLPPGHWRVDYTATTLGKCLVGLGRFAEAETLLVPAGERLKAAKGASPRVRKAALENVVALYQAWGRPGQATPWRESLKALAQPVPPK